MGVLPGGLSDVATTKGIYLVSAYSNGDQSIADLVGNDEATVKARFKSHYLNSTSSVWGNPSGILAQVFSVLGAIPGMGLVEAIIAAIINAIVAVLGPIPVVGTLVETLASFLGVTHTTANSAQAAAGDAQASANVANTEIAIIKADLAADSIGGAALSDRFDGAAAGSLDATNWSQTYTGPGVGYLGLDGSGNAQWFTSGGGPRSSINCFLTPLDTDNEAVAVLLGSVPDTTNATWPEILLLLRMDGAGNAVAARINNGHVEFGYLASNAFVSLASPIALAMSGQQSYQFKARTVGATHTFTILQDNVEIATLTSPTSGPTLYGASYRQPGWIAAAGTFFGAFFVFFQSAPPIVRVFSAGDIA